MSINAWCKNLSSNGVARMIAVINSKLNEMTGSEDKILADYVVILVQSGKTEEEVKTNVETFLRHRSGPFVSWLFDHLASSQHYYISPQPNIQSESPQPMIQAASPQPKIQSASPQPKFQSADQSNIFSQTSSKTDQTDSSVNAKFLGGYLVGSAKHSQQNPYNIDEKLENNNTDIAKERVFERMEEDEDNITDIARKSVFERLGEVEENNIDLARKGIFERRGEVDDSAYIARKSVFERLGEVENNNTDIARKTIFGRLGNFHELNKNFDGEIQGRNRKRSRAYSPPSQYGNNRIISDTDFTTSKRPKVEDKPEFPAAQVIRSCPTNAIGRPGINRKVFGTPRNTRKKEKRNSVFDRLGEKIDLQRKGLNRVAANEGTHTAQNLETKSIALSNLNRIAANEGTHTSQNSDTRSVFVSNVHYGATSQALTEHFMPCGEVTSVQILNNIFTGQPTGNAVVEFASKEAVDRALSMNGSTFMYRMLQIVPKSLAQTTTGREHVQSSRNFQWIRDSSTVDYFANPRNPAPSTNITNLTRPLVQTTGPRNFQWRRYPSTTNNLANPSNPAPSSNIANSTRPLAPTTTRPRNFMWRRDPSATDNLTNPVNPISGSNVDNPRRQPTSQPNPPHQPNPSWKFKF